MSARLAAGVAVSALLRRVNDAGGLGVVRARGDADAGGVLVIVDEADGPRALERGLGPNGMPALVEARRGDDLEEWWRRRRARDPDLWVVELNIVEAERLVAEILLVH